MQSLSPIITVPRRFWDVEYGACPLPKAVNVTFEVAGQPVEDLFARGFVSVAEDSELKLSGLWSICQDHFPGHLVADWVRVGDDTIKLRLQPPDPADEQRMALGRKRQAPSEAPDGQPKLPALGGRPLAEWEGRELAAPSTGMDWRQDGRDAARAPVEPPQRLVAPVMVPTARLGSRRGGAGGRARGGSRASTTGRGCAKLVRTTTRLYIGVGQVREWLGEVGARTELQVKVMLDNRMHAEVHPADLLYNKGAHYYWITSRTLKRAAMGKWFLGWNHTPADGLVLLLRSPSKDEIAAAIAEGFQGKEDDDEEDQQQQVQQLLMQQQPSLQAALSPPSPRLARAPQPRPVLPYSDEEALLMMQQQQPPGPEVDDGVEGGQYHRAMALQGGARLPQMGEEEDDISGLSGDSELRKVLGPSDPRLMVALAAELQRGLYGPGGAAGAMNANRRGAQAQNLAPGPSRGYTGGRDARDAQQPLLTSRSQPNPLPQMLGQLPGGVPAQYRGSLGRTASEGLNAQVPPPAPVPVPRSSGGQASRLTNFSEVPGGTAFAAVLPPAEGLGLEPPPPLAPPQQQRGGTGAMLSQLGATTSIASNLSMPGATQLTGTGSLLQASGIAGPVAAAPLRLPANVSELLPPEYLPAAVSVRCTLDGSLQPQIFPCEIHRTGHQGHCYLYNLPPSVLEGRSQQDWMISEDGCLVLCLKTVPQAQVLVENKSVRSAPSHPQGGSIIGTASVSADLPGARPSLPSRVQPNVERPSPSAHAQNPDPDDLGAPTLLSPPAGFAVGGIGGGSPQVPSPHEHLPEDAGYGPGAAATGTAAAEPPVVAATLPVLEPKPDARRERAGPLVIPRQAMDSLYGAVKLPHPVLVRFQVNGELEAQVYLAEVVDAGGELVIRGIPHESLAGRTLTGWRRTNVWSHQLLVVCLESRLEAEGLQAKSVSATTSMRQGREEDLRRSRADYLSVPQQATPTSAQQQLHPQPHLPLRTSEQPGQHWGGLGEPPLHPPPSRPRQAGGSPGNAFASLQPTFSGAPRPSSIPPPSRPSLPSLPLQSHHHQPASGPLSARQHPQRPPSADGSPQLGMPPPPLQPVFSGTLAGVGSSKLPLSQPLLQTSNSLLPAQGGYMPERTSGAPGSGARPESPALGGAATGRPMGPLPGPRGPVGGSTGAPRPQSSNPEPSNANLLSNVASAAHATPMLAPSGRPTVTPRSAPAATMYPWQLESGSGAAAVAGGNAPTVFAQYGLNLETASSIGPPDMSLAAKRPQHHQPQTNSSGRGASGSGSGQADANVFAGSTPKSRSAGQPGEFGSGNASGVQVHMQQPQSQQQQQRLTPQSHPVLQVSRQQHEGADQDIRRSTGAPAPGTGDVEVDAAGRPVWPNVGSGDHNAASLAAVGSAGDSDAVFSLRYLTSQAAGGPGRSPEIRGVASDGAVAERAVDLQPPHAQYGTEHPIAHHHLPPLQIRTSQSLRFELQEQHSTPRLDGSRGGRGTASDSSHELGPPLGVVRSARSRWGPAAASPAAPVDDVAPGTGEVSHAAAGGGASDERRSQSQSRYREEPSSAGFPRIVLSPTPDGLHVPASEGPDAGGATSSRGTAAGTEARRSSHGLGAVAQHGGDLSYGSGALRSYDAIASVELRDPAMSSDVNFGTAGGGTTAGLLQGGGEKVQGAQSHLMTPAPGAGLKEAAEEPSRTTLGSAQD
ncbi:hypothetical protein Agub_g9252, partial [Astrephomene gubernaculifera]